MRFGAVPDSALQTIDLSLPAEPATNRLVLNGKRAAKPKVYVGASTWGDKSWTGSIYPAKTPAVAYRSLYPQYFNSIELNATHYNIYPPETIKNWAGGARGRDFKFCPKFPQTISHYSNLAAVRAPTDAFLESIIAFEDLLGPAFIQLSESFSPANSKALFDYLASLPADVPFFAELRHPDWFTEGEALFNNLRSLRVGAVITDAPGRRDVAHMHLTVPKLLLRFVCNGVHSTSFSRADAWMQRIRYWIDNGLEEAYLFMHPGNDAAIPELVTYWINGLNKHCGLALQPPAILQPGLF
jgi:uncharacterized protein YecE (DUF72 family)